MADHGNTPADRSDMRPGLRREMETDGQIAVQYAVPSGVISELQTVSGADQGCYIRVHMIRVDVMPDKDMR